MQTLMVNKQYNLLFKHIYLRDKWYFALSRRYLTGVNFLLICDSSKIWVTLSLSLRQSANIDKM
jgi:hypothetical protein